MSQPNDSVACFRDSMYNNAANNEKSEWTKPKPMNFTEQLEKLHKVRQSLYSTNGWCSTNVNQISKWDVGDMDTIFQPNNMQQHSHDTGTNIWNENLSQQTVQTIQPPCPIVPNSSPTSCITPQITEWKNTGAIPKMFNLGNLNCLTNYEFPYGSPSQTPQLNTNVFHDCDTTTKSSDKNMDDVNLALRLQLETMHLDTDYNDESKNHSQNMNQISNICQISNQYQVDCLPQAFS